MALINTLEKNGNFLFRNRSYFPLILFLLAIPVIYFTPYSTIDNDWVLMSVTIFSVLLSFLGFIIRALAIGTAKKNTSGRNANEQIADALNTTGIYSIVRHPLYLGNYFMWIGIVAYTFNIWYFIIISLVFWIYYERIMFAEERFLEKKFGEEYMEWAQHVPPFWPRFKNYRQNEIPFSFKTILRREYSGITATIIGFLFVDIVRLLVISGKDFCWPNYFTWLLVIAIFITLLLRTLKKNTSILREEGRT